MAFRSSMVEIKYYKITVLSYTSKVCLLSYSMPCFRITNYEMGVRVTLEKRNRYGNQLSLFFSSKKSSFLAIFSTTRTFRSTLMLPDKIDDQSLESCQLYGRRSALVNIYDTEIRGVLSIINL